jgi:serine/threonine protein kinase
MKALLDVSRSDPGGALCLDLEQSTLMAAPPSREPGQATEPAGRRLVAERYELRSLLGRGGMGLVWLADDQLLHRSVALKEVIPSDTVSEKSRKAALRRALGEARAAARVHHDGVITIHDLVKEDGWPWIVMERLSGRTLAEAVKADGPLSIEQVTCVGLRLLDVLQATHAAGIIHRDVKPGNVYLCHSGRLVLTDFGIACPAGDDTRGTEYVFAGSPGYASPERLRGEQPEPAADLFSLGATLFTAVEGRPPFQKGDVLATIAAVIEDLQVPLLRAGPLRVVIEGLLAKDPDRRLSADEAGVALRAIQRRTRRRRQ